MNIGIRTSDKTELAKTSALGAAAGLLVKKTYNAAKPAYEASINKQTGWLDTFAKRANPDTTVKQYIDGRIKNIERHSNLEEIAGSIERLNKTIKQKGAKSPRASLAKANVLNEHSQIYEKGAPAVKKELEIQKGVLESGTTSKKLAIKDTISDVAQSVSNKFKAAKDEVSSLIGPDIKTTGKNIAEKTKNTAKNLKKAVSDFAATNTSTKLKKAGKAAAPIIIGAGVALGAKTILDKIKSKKEN